MPPANILSREKVPYLLTIIFAVAAWGATHIVDGLLKSPLIEYSIFQYYDGKKTRLEYTLTNVSRSKSFKNLTLEFLLPANGQSEFIENSCAVEHFAPLSVADEPILHKDTFQYTIGQFHPNGKMRIILEITGKQQPTLHHSSKNGQPVLLSRASKYTWLARNEQTVIFWMTIVFILLMISYGIYIRITQSDKELNSLQFQVGQSSGKMPNEDNNKSD
jgi:hypothetical protein